MDCISQIYYLNIALIFVLLRFRNKTKVVGTKLELEHTAPTPVGMTVTCESELVAVEGRKLTFKVALHDEKGPVGGGTHERFVVNDAKFAAKAEAKKG